MKSSSLDRNLMERYYECLNSHPETKLKPLAIQQFDLHAILAGEVVHVMVARGNDLTVQWVPVAPSIKFLFDAYAA